jgi:hypothetical protein
MPLRFALQFALAFALLALPWPHWHDLWRSAFLRIANGTLARVSGSREISTEILQPAVHGSDFRFTIVNRDLMNSDGSGPVRNLDLSVAQTEMRPMAFLFALIFATPLAWKKRAGYFVAGAVLLQAVILGILSFCLWRESMELLLAPDSPSVKTAASAVRDGLVQYAGYVLPVIIWLLLCVRDWSSLIPAPTLEESQPSETVK